MGDSALRRLAHFTLLYCLIVLWLAVPASGTAPAQNVESVAYLGLTDCDSIVEHAGDLYLACHSAGDALPGPVLNGRSTGMDAYVVRIDPAKNRIVYATRIGGSRYTAAFKIAVDDGGEAFVVGQTDAADLPTTSDAVQRSFGGGRSDGFLVIVASSGQVRYSTYLGGDGSDSANAIAIDSEGNAFVGGTTSSADFPGSPGGSIRKSKTFLARIQFRDAPKLISMTFGGGDESLDGIALLSPSRIAMAGTTRSAKLPIMGGGQRDLNGPSDAFIAIFRTTRLRPTYASYLGGSGEDNGWDVVSDSQGHPVVVGATASGDFEGLEHGFQRRNHGGYDLFLSRFDGKRWHSTFFGGTADDAEGGACVGCNGADLAIDRRGDMWIVGHSHSADLPLKNPLYSTASAGHDSGFVAAFSPDVHELCFSSYLDIPGDTVPEGIAVRDNQMWVSGLTDASQLPSSPYINRDSKTLGHLNGKDSHSVIISISHLGRLIRGCDGG